MPELCLVRVLSRLQRQHLKNAMDLRTGSLVLFVSSLHVIIIVPPMESRRRVASAVNHSAGLRTCDT